MAVWNIIKKLLDILPQKNYIASFFIAGWSSLVARRAHNPKVIGSNPVPATKTTPEGIREV